APAVLLPPLPARRRAAGAAAAPLSRSRLAVREARPVRVRRAGPGAARVLDRGRAVRRAGAGRATTPYDPDPGFPEPGIPGAHGATRCGFPSVPAAPVRRRGPFRLSVPTPGDAPVGGVPASERRLKAALATDI
ncbi:hypothetical protein ACWGIO_28910, partial [Streptomyces sp. NPDC054797]